ncbi:hypothetical protein Pmar_PMAR008355 [Perkinsus marinus ATCC 50983]|uniref:Uncharacterized protein n=1 Tax=Perkinsus marinus (strain ATCC 50983 / TXsc) TaxID=423536 RepID=C5LGZ0_PERM5|nr:hypothetical protein Pmar_PMAR008355 [Perkinsus marinus ATCC 50983]EER04003.1 hypothetical protein Pmar_PMAR008355 [Perkinsus marinus ATCC 50983]|eukprot:XP_002772187.1 hypothetical protein Pmar_PMAR008355 [Perkinsus marinus ATCC 50983]
MPPRHLHLAMEAADGTARGNASLLEALLEDVEVLSCSSGTVSPKAPSPRAVWADEEDCDVVEPLVSALRETVPLEVGELSGLWVAWEEAARDGVEAWRAWRDASDLHWAEVKHALREAWQNEPLLSPEGSDGEDPLVGPSSGDAVDLEATSEVDGGVEGLSDGIGQPCNYPTNGTPEWAEFRGRIDEVLSMALEEEVLEKREEALFESGAMAFSIIESVGHCISECSLPPSPLPALSDPYQKEEATDLDNTTPRADQHMTIAWSDHAPPPKREEVLTSSLGKEAVPIYLQQVQSDTKAQYRELCCMVREDALVAAQASVTEHERGRVAREDTCAQRQRQWELYQRRLEARQKELAWERTAMGWADQACRAWAQRQRQERSLMSLADDHSAAQRMEERREMEGRRMLRAMHDSRAYRIYTKALWRNREAMVVEDLISGEARE